MSVVFALPPNDSCKILVNLLSLYGTCVDYWSEKLLRKRTLLSVNALMTFPSADRDLLIFLASSRFWPEAPVLPTFSEPAKSTNASLPTLRDPSWRFFC